MNSARPRQGRSRSRTVQILAGAVFGVLATTQAVRAEAVGARGIGSVSNPFVVPSGVGQFPLVAVQSNGALWFNACAASCRATDGLSVPLSPAAQARGGAVSFEVLEVGSGRRVLRAVVSENTPQRSFQVLVAARIGATGVELLFAGSTASGPGRLLAEDGVDVQLPVLQFDKRRGGTRVLVGVARSDVHLCGRATLLSPRLLVGSDLRLHGAKLQRLSREERAGAIPLRVERSDQAKSVQVARNPLRAMAGSSSRVGGKPDHLTDGLESSFWSEARGGSGRGEFVTFRADPDVGLSAIEWLVRGSGVEEAQAVAPKALWLATSSALYRLEWPEDAWSKPGQWYRTQFSEPQHSDCYALILDRGQGQGKDVHVTLSEVRGVSQISALAVEELLERLSLPGLLGDEAAAELRGGSQATLHTVAEQFFSLNGLARQRAWKLLGVLSCEVTAKLSSRVLATGTEVERDRAFQRLGRCATKALPSLQAQSLELEGAAALLFLERLADLAPALAVELVVEQLRNAKGRSAADFRDVLWRASRHASAEAVVRETLANTKLPSAVGLHLLRAIATPWKRFESDLSLLFGRVFGQAKTFRTRYLLIEPAGKLARLATTQGADDSVSARGYLLALLRGSDPYLRAAAAEQALEGPEFGALLERLTRDENVRVRQAAVQNLANVSKSGSPLALLERLREDRWPIVRGAAVRALVDVAPSDMVDQQLAVSAREDDSVNVRERAVAGIGHRGAVQFSALLLELLEDVEQVAEVRAAAAISLGQLCVSEALPVLTQAALTLTNPRVTAPAQTLAKGALAALGLFAPADLAERLAPLSQPNVSAAVRRAAGEAVRNASLVAVKCPTVPKD